MRIHLIRHGEVANPRQVVYADLPGFTLSERGREQAAAAGARLHELAVPLVVSSPLERAVATSRMISIQTHAEMVIDPRLTEWRLVSRWAGIRWEALGETFPGELEAYLADPQQLSFSSESLLDLAQRMTAAIGDWSVGGQREDVVYVSHQDPIQAALRSLTEAGFADYHNSKPEHGSISSLQNRGHRWIPTGYWAPPQ